MYTDQPGQVANRVHVTVTTSESKVSLNPEKSQLFIAVSTVKESVQTALDSLARSLFIVLRQTASTLDMTFIAHTGIMKGRFSICWWKNWCDAY